LIGRNQAKKSKKKKQKKDEIILKILRDGKEIQIKVKLEERPRE